MTFPPFVPINPFDDDPLEEPRRQIEETVRTVGDVGESLLDGGARQIKTEIETVQNAGSDLFDGAKNAAGSYVDSAQDVADDLAHGNVPGAIWDATTAPVEAATDLVEGAGKAGLEVLEGGGKVLLNGIETAGDVAGDVIGGAGRLIGIGGDDKEGTLKRVGSVDEKELKSAKERQKRSHKQLDNIKHKLAQKNPAAFKTADELLKPGEIGFQFFHWFLGAYRAWTGSKITTPQLQKRYRAEHGMRFDALVRDGKDLGRQGDKLDTIDNQLQAAYNQLVPHWQGTAASQFQTTMSTFFQADRNVIDNFGIASLGTNSLALALEKLIYAKANAVASLYSAELAPGIDGVQARQTMVNVAKNQHCNDQQRRWVLGTFGQEMRGRHDWDDDTDMWSTSALDDGSRRNAQQVATQWCNQVLKVVVERRLEQFDATIQRTTAGINEIFETFVQSLTVANPYAGMSASAPSDGPTTPQGSAGSGGGGAAPGGGGGGTTAPAGGGGGQPQVPIPDVGAPATGENSPTSPAGTTPGTTPGTSGVPGVPGVPGTSPTTGVPGLPAGTVPTNPADAPKTNPDGSVSFGPGHSLKLSRINRDGSINLEQMSANGTQKYHVTFGPNGHPAVTTVDAAGAIVTPEGVSTNADGSVTLDGDLTIGTDEDGDFLLTEKGTNGETHAYQVEYDDQGAPHVTDATQAGAGTGAADYRADLAAASAQGAETNADLAAGASDLGAGTGSADFSPASSAAGDTGGTAASGSPDAGSGAGGSGAGGAGAAAAHAGSEGIGSQLGAGSQFGAQTGTESAGAATAAPAAAAAGGQQGGTRGGGFVGGMPPMGAGMGGAGGGNDAIERKYALRPESVLDDGDLEQWDRLGPTIG